MDKKVLIIEDEPETVLFVRNALEMKGYKVFIARQGKEGMDIARREKPHIILLDVVLPHMNGYEVAKRIREDILTRQSYVIFMSGHMTEPEDKVQGFDMGADEYLTKPFRIQELLSKIESFFRRMEQHNPE